jgi:hypothetical protein
VPLPPLSSIRRRWGVLILIVAGVLLLALGDRALGSIIARFTLPTRSAQWIWEPRNRRDLSPADFYAVRDFTLDRVPARARLLASGDEEYILSLNGARIGAGGWQPGAPLDVWEVGPLLQPGSNRLLAEVRSDRGAGGFLLSLQTEDGRPLVGTDDTWRIFHRHELGLLRGWLPLTGDDSPPSVPAESWGLPPMGRWGRPKIGPVHPLLNDLIRGRPVPAVSAVNLPNLGRPLPDRQTPPLRLFDWGRIVTGYLLVDVEPSADLGVALLYTDAAAPPSPLEQRPANGILVLPGRRTWMDAHPRRFRYALVAGLPSAVTARVQEVDPVKAAGLVVEGPVKPARGVLGIVPPPLRTPVEDEVWRDLESVPGVAGGKKR